MAQGGSLEVVIFYRCYMVMLPGISLRGCDFIQRLCHCYDLGSVENLLGMVLDAFDFIHNQQCNRPKVQTLQVRLVLNGRLLGSLQPEFEEPWFCQLLSSMISQTFVCHGWKKTSCIHVSSYVYYCILMIADVYRNMLYNVVHIHLYTIGTQVVPCLAGLICISAFFEFYTGYSCVCKIQTKSIDFVSPPPALRTSECVVTRWRIHNGTVIVKFTVPWMVGRSMLETPEHENTLYILTCPAMSCMKSQNYVIELAFVRGLYIVVLLLAMFFIIIVSPCFSLQITWMHHSSMQNWVSRCTMRRDNGMPSHHHVYKRPCLGCTQPGF